MMGSHPPLERLSELIDGDLPLEHARELERHVAACETCQAGVEGLRVLLKRAAALPTSIDSPDVWLDVRGRLAGRARPAGSLWGTGLAQHWGARAAAALLLVAASSATTVLVLRSWPRQPATVSATHEARAPRTPVVLAVERSYSEAIDELSLTLRAGRDSLSPGTLATLERALGVIDAAIAEARAALEADPSNGALLDVLSANYEHKVQLLRRVSELPART